ALVVALAEAGVKPGDELDLSSPVEVLRAFGADVTCKASAPLKRGKRMTAVEIQRRYLAAAEAQLGEPILPAWAAEACAAWREALDLLETDPRALGGVLDWGIKLGLFRRHAERRGMAWDPDPARRPSRGRVPDPAFFQELFELDTRCGILGEQGLFPQLERAGAAVLSFPGVDGIERAMEEPPRTTRAKVRGECIRRLAGSAGRYVCDWQGILDLQEGRMLDLSDPFEAAERWKKLPDGRGPRSRLEREMELRLLLANAAAGREAADILDDAGDVADDEDEGDAGGGASSGGAPF
ncbi:MAG: proteasome accessory factor PafA2 family protein, partial [Planctomycetes bacterium]|nr:proteasome accessory factor PafA2 family protein [Planctomycetota bacterium]